MKKICVLFITGILIFLLACCTPKPETVTYTVTFNTDGGSEVTPVEVEAESTVPVPDDPVKEGYVFRGWYTAPFNVGWEYNFDSPVRSDKVIYAWWAENIE